MYGTLLGKTQTMKFFDIINLAEKTADKNINHIIKQTQYALG